MELPDGEAFGVGQKALSGLRGGYVGMLMFGMLGTIVGLALLNPFSIGAGLLLGARASATSAGGSFTSGRPRRRPRMRRYVDDVTFQVGKDSRDMLRGVQRELRDHFTDAGRGDEPLAARSRCGGRAVGCKSPRPSATRRLAEIAAELARLEALRKRAPDAHAGRGADAEPAARPRR